MSCGLRRAAPPTRRSTQLLAERTRVGLWIMLAALAVLWATDVSLDATLVRSPQR